MALLTFKTGFEIDFHQLAAGRKLWIGGIKSDHQQLMSRFKFYKF